MNGATSAAKGGRAADRALPSVTPGNWTLSISGSVRSAAALQNVTEELIGGGSPVPDFPIFDKFKSFGWQWVCHSRDSWAQELAFDLEICLFSESDRMKPLKSDVNISRSDPGLAVLMAFNSFRGRTSSATS